MATVYRDFLSVPRSQQAGANAVYQLFDKAWPKEYINGTLVYSHALPYVVSNMLILSPAALRFLNRLGVTKESILSKSYDGIEVALFWLNTAKVGFTPKLDVDISTDINMAYNVGDEFEVSVKYGGDLKRYVDNHWSTQPDGTVVVDTAAIRATLNSDPLKYFANTAITPNGVMFHTANPDPIYEYYPGTNTQVGTTPLTQVDYNPIEGNVFDVIALLDDGTTFEEIGIRNEVFKAVETKDQYGNVALVGEYSYIVKFRCIAETTGTSHIVTQCKLVADALAASMSYHGEHRYKTANQAIDTKIKEAITAFNSYVSVNHQVNISLDPDVPEYVSVFLNGRLRVDAARMMKRKDFVKILKQAFDHAESYTDNSHWYDVVIAIVIVIIAIIIIALTWFTGYGAAAGCTLASFGVGLAAGSVFLTLASMLYAAAFPDATAQIQALGKVTQIVGYAAAIVNVYNVAVSSSNLMQTTGAVLQGGSIVADIMGEDDISTTLRMVGSGFTMLSNMDAFKDMTFESLMTEGSTTFSDAMSKFTTEVTKSITELPQSILDSVSNIASGSVLTGTDSISLGQVSGWMKNINTAMSMYNQFFVTPHVSPIGYPEQPDKESGVDEYYAVITMLDNTDILDRVDLVKQNSFGAQSVESFLASIS